MSSLTLEVIAETARNRLNLPESDNPRLKTMVPNALKSLAIKIARRSDYQALRKEINVACAAGVITLADTSLLTEVLLETGELILNGSFVKWVPTYEDLTATLPADTYRASLRGSTKVYVTNLGTGALGAVTQNGTLAFNYTPTLDELPDAYDEQLIDEVVILGSGKVESSPAAAMQKDDGGGMNVNLNAR